MKINLKSFDLIKDKSQKFKVFYKYRFNKEYLEHNIKKKLQNEESLRKFLTKYYFIVLFILYVKIVLT